MTTPVVIAFTPNYFVPATTTVKSLLEASTGRFKFICLLTEEIPEEMRRQLDVIGAGRAEFEFLTLKGRLEGTYIDPRYSEAASFRLLLPELLPEYDKVVYIDCDIIVRQDIGSLYYSTDLGENLLAAVYEAPIENQPERWKALGCDPEAYFNSGFLLMNLARMREEKTSSELIEATKVDYLEFPDQDALNIVCKGRVLPLSPLWNGIRTFFLPQYKSDFIRRYKSDELWNEVQEKATIHYTGGKPWNLFTVQFHRWWRVYESLPEKVRKMWKPNGKIFLLWRIYRTAAGRTLIDLLQTFYRKIRR